MIRMLLKQMLRGIFRDKFHSFINVFGLGLGIACCIIGLLFIQDEWSADRRHANVARLHRYGVQMTIGGVTSVQTTCNAAAGPLLKEFIPGIESYIRVGPAGEILVKHKTDVFQEENFLWADPGLLTAFSHPLVHGNPADGLNRDNTTVLTRSLARKIFGESNPVGQMLDIENHGPFEITGVIADPPLSDHLQFSALLSFPTLFQGLDQAELFQPSKLSGGMGYGLYFLFAPGFTAEDFAAQERRFYAKYQAAVDGIQYLGLVEPLADIRLRSNLDSGQAAVNARFLFWFGGIVLFILFLACVNYVNLTTARASKRAREIGIKKVVGSSHGALVAHLLAESLVFVLVALAAGVILAQVILALTPLNEVIGKNLQVSLLSNSALLPALAAIWAIVGVLAGLYPAFYLARLSPVRTFRGKAGAPASGRFIRQALLVAQFVITIAAVALTLLMVRQLDYIRDMDLGFRKDNVVLLKVTEAGLLKRVDTFKEEVSRCPGVVAAACSNAVPGLGYTGFAFNWETASGEMKPRAFPSLQADQDYFRTMDIRLVKGRNFSRPATSADFQNRSFEVIVNECLVRKMGWQDPIGKRFQFGTVIGVVRDYHFVPLHYDMRPVFITPPVEPAPYVSVRIRGDRIRETLQQLQARWGAFAPGHPFAYTFLDQRLARIYADDEKQQKLATLFAGICLLISCLGLFALASFNIGQRTKEIGIRRALGASLAGVVMLLGRRFVMWVLLANALAWPLTYLAMRQWLESFAYRTPIGIGVFLLAGASVLFVALMTVGVQSVRAARANPVESLRYE